MTRTTLQVCLSGIRSLEILTPDFRLLRQSFFQNGGNRIW